MTKTLKIMIVLALLLGSIPAFCQNVLLWHADMETNDFSQWAAEWNDGSCTETIVTSPVHTGTYAGALNMVNHCGARLAQDNISGGLLPNTAYYGVWYYFTQNVSAPNWWNIFQWKRAKYPYGTGSDPLYDINIGNRGDGSMYLYLYKHVNNNGGYGGTGEGVAGSASGNVPLNTWTHVECYYSWSMTATGEVKCWQDGTQIWDVQNVVTEYSYLPQDSYRDRQWSVNNYSDNTTPATQTIYVDDATIYAAQTGTTPPSAAYNSYISKYQSYATQYYISPSGSGTTCSQASPCSFSTGMGKAGAGVVIWFLPGVYNFSGHFNVNTSGTSTNHAAFVSTTYAGAKLVGAGTGTDNGYALWMAQGQYVDIVGMEITGNGESAAIMGGSGPGSYNTVAYNRVHDVAYSGCGGSCGAAGIAIGNFGSTGTSNIVENNVIWNVGVGTSGSASPHCIYTGSTGDIVRNNIIYNCSGGGIHAYHIDNWQGAKIVNNTVVNARQWGIVFGADSGTITGMTVANNILIGNPTGIAECCSGSYSGNTLTDNLFYNNRTTYNVSETPTGTITSNPNVVNLTAPSDNPGGGDFHLQAGSPAIGAGSNTYASTLDFDGVTRPNPPSIGALEPASTNSSYTLTVTESGNGSGTVTSYPAGINCPGTCSASFFSGTSVTLNAVPASGSISSGLSGGGCSGSVTCTTTVNANTNIIATFSLNGPVPASNLDSGANSNSISSFTTNSITPVANELTIATVRCTDVTALPTVSSITGNGLTWSKVNSASNTNGGYFRGIEVWSAPGIASPTSGAASVTLSGTSSLGCWWSIDQYSASGVSVIQSVTGSSGASTVTSQTINLAALQNSSSLGVGSFGWSNNSETLSPGTGFTLLSSSRSGDVAAQAQVEYKQNTTAIVDNSSASAYAFGVAYEIGPSPSTNYTLSTSTAGTGSGTITGSNCAGTHASGSNYLCTLNPASGSNIASVTGCNGTLSGTTYSGVMPASNCTVTATFNLNTPPPNPNGCSVNNPALYVSSPVNLPGATQNASYSYQFTALGGTLPYTWSSSTLPLGLSISPAGVLSGTPTVSGTSTFTVSVSDSSATPQNASQCESLSVNTSVPPLTINTQSLPAGTINVAYSQTLQASGGTSPYTWSKTSGNLPTGLSLASNGAITGTPTVPGTSTFTVQVSDSATPANTTSATFSILIQGPSINIVQHASVEGSSVTSIAKAFTNNNTAGNTIVVLTRASTTTQTITPSDSQGNTYTTSKNEPNGGDGSQVQINCAANIKAGANTVTDTFNGTNNHPWMAIYEVSGMPSTCTLDSVMTDGAAAQSGTPPVTVGTSAHTSTVPNELLFSVYDEANNGTNTITAGTGFTLGEQDTNTSKAATEYQITTTTGSYAGQFNVTNGGVVNWAVASVGFKGATQTSPTVFSGLETQTLKLGAGGGSGNAPYTLTPAGSPGSNMTIVMNPTGAYQDNYYYTNVGSTDSGTQFTYNTTWQIPNSGDLTRFQAVETDLHQSTSDGWSCTGGIQFLSSLDSGDGGPSVRQFDFGNNKWVTISGLTMPLIDTNQHTLSYQFTIDHSAHTYQFNSITIDGTKTNLNQTYNCKQLNWADVTNVAVQQDGDNNADPWQLNVTNWSVSYQ